MKTLSADQLKKIAELASVVPQEHRAKCFELLLSHALHTLEMPEGVADLKQPQGAPASPPTTKPFLVPIDVKAFLSQYSLDEAKLGKLFLFEGSDVRPIYNLKATQKAKVQIQLALLMALENALKTGQFQFEIEALRKRCVDQKCYDSLNFKSILKRNQKLFKSLEDDQPLMLSPVGKSELADLIEAINK